MAIDHVTLMTVSDEGVDIGNLPKAETPMSLPMFLKGQKQWVS